MKYILENIKLRVVSEGKTNAGSLFIQADLVNPDDPFDDPGNCTIFNNTLAAKYAEYLQVAQPSGKTDAFGNATYAKSLLKDASKPLPEVFTMLTHAQWEEFVFPKGEPYFAVDDQGNRRTNERGNFIQRTSIFVLTKKTVDNETGELHYVKGMDPVSQGTSIMNNFYKPASAFGVDTGVDLPQEGNLVPPGGEVPAV